MSKYSRLANLVLSVLLAGVLLVGVGYGLKQVAATTVDDNYAIVLDGLDAPNYGRAAPYGQWIVTHNAVNVTTTQQIGTVARTNGYAERKSILCDVGTAMVTGTLYARTTSAGSVYTLSGSYQLAANNRTVITVTQIAPWMSWGLEGEAAGSTTTCGIYVQTP